MHLLSKDVMQSDSRPSLTREATLTEVEPSLAISRYCAILPQIRGELRIIV